MTRGGLEDPPGLLSQARAEDKAHTGSSTGLLELPPKSTRRRTLSNAPGEAPPPRRPLLLGTPRGWPPGWPHAGGSGHTPQCSEGRRARALRPPSGTGRTRLESAFSEDAAIERPPPPNHGPLRCGEAQPAQCPPQCPPPSRSRRVSPGTQRLNLEQGRSLPGRGQSVVQTPREARRPRAGNPEFFRRRGPRASCRDRLPLSRVP